MAMNLDSRKGGVKASRFYGLMFVVLTGILGMVSPPDLALMTVQAQTAEERKAEEDRILKSCRDNLNAQKFQEGLLACQSALKDFKKIENLRGQWIVLNNIGFAYNYLSQYQNAIDNFEQSLKIAREIKERRGEGNALGNLGIAYYSLGKYDKAIEFQLQSLVVLKRKG